MTYAHTRARTLHANYMLTVNVLYYTHYTDIMIIKCLKEEKEEDEKMITADVLKTQLVIRLISDFFRFLFVKKKSLRALKTLDSRLCV